MTQTSLLSLVEPTEISPKALVDVLSDGRWHHREALASRLNCSVRAIRDAASHAQGQILSGNNGLKITICGTPEEVNEALGRLRSQVREMQRRLIETEKAWHSR